MNLFLGPVLLAIVLAAIGTLVFAYGDTPVDVKPGRLGNFFFPPGRHIGKGVGIVLWVAALSLIWKVASGA